MARKREVIEMATRYIVGRAIHDGFKVQGIASTRLEAIALARAVIDELGIGAKFKSRIAETAAAVSADLDRVDGRSVRLSNLWAGPQVIVINDGA